MLCSNFENGKKADIELLNTITFEEAEKYLKNLGYFESDSADSEANGCADRISDIYFSLVDEDDNIIDTIAFVQFYNSNILDGEDIYSDLQIVKEYWERL